MELPQTNLFGEIENDCQREWNGMPEYQNVKQEDPEITATFKFRNYKDFKRVNIPYSCKLLMQELQCMSIAPRFITE